MRSKTATISRSQSRRVDQHYVLWKFSQYGEYAELRRRHSPMTLLTPLGSPLGDENVRKKLEGGSASGERRYFNNVKSWANFAGVGDYISRGATTADDIREMRAYGLTPTLRDAEKIYSLAVRGEYSNPDHSTGYLIHPLVIGEIMDRLNA